MDDVLERFPVQFRDLRERSRRLSAELRGVSRGLSEDGQVPSRSLIADLRRFGGDFCGLRLQGRLDGHDGPDQADPSVESASLSDLEQQFEHRVVVRSAMVMLDRMNAVQLSDERDAAHWQRCLIEGRALRRELATSPLALAAAQAKRLVSSDHPLGAVVTLIADREELTDERWRTLHEAVIELYGRDLATAIVRQRLTLGGE